MARDLNSAAALDLVMHDLTETVPHHVIEAVAQGTAELGN